MINKTYDAMIQKWIGDNRQWIMDNWMDLVRVPSVRSEAEPLAPFGPECARAVKTAARMFEQKGFSVRINEADGYALADSGEGEKTIAMFGHADVVPVGEGWQITEPFTPLVQNGRLFGRGASDDKSGIIASLCIMSMFRELGIPVKSRIRAFIGSNEESGMGDVTAFVQKEEMPDLCLVPDGGFPCSLGEKGILRMWAKSAAPLSAIRQMQGGNAFNIVLDRVDTQLAPNAALEAELRELCAADSGCTLTVAEDGTLCLRADGVAKHAGSPDGSVNATYLTANLLARCRCLPESDRRQMACVAQYLSSPWGEGMGIDHVDTSFGNLTAVNGMVAVEEGCLKVSLDIRYGTELDPVGLEESLEKLWDKAGFAIVYMNNRPGYRVDPESPVPGMIRDICAQLTGIEKNCYFMAGGTYGRYLKNTYTVGVCTDFVGREELPPLPAGHGGAHQRDEAISIEGFMMSIRILAHIVLNCDKLIHGEA